MDEFPFTKGEWASVSKAMNSLVNASLQDDDILRKVYFQELQRILRRLGRRYGEHPVLLETEGDVTHGPRRRVKLYRKAIQLAVEHKLPTYTIRVSLADVLLDLDESQCATAELLACQPELAERADDFEKWQWQEVMARCQTSQKT
jgi:hypothetical protein